MIAITELSHYMEIRKMGKLKAYIVNDKWNDAGSIVVWAETRGKAKSNALYNDVFDGCEYTELRTERVKDFDKYADTKKVPIQELLNMSCWFSCRKCGEEYLDYDKIADDEAFIDDVDYSNNDFVKGSVICAECKKKLEECGKW